VPVRRTRETARVRSRIHRRRIPLGPSDTWRRRVRWLRPVFSDGTEIASMSSARPARRPRRRAQRSKGAPAPRWGDADCSQIGQLVARVAIHTVSSPLLHNPPHHKLIPYPPSPPLIGRVTAGVVSGSADRSRRDGPATLRLIDDVSRPTRAESATPAARSARAGSVGASTGGRGYGLGLACHQRHHPSDHPELTSNGRVANLVGRRRRRRAGCHRRSRLGS